MLKQRLVFPIALLTLSAIALLDGLLATSLPVRAAGNLPAPTSLRQHDLYGELPLGALLGRSSLTLQFDVEGETGNQLLPELELRPVDQPFSEANLVGEALIASGESQTVVVRAPQPLDYKGYHWRARVRGPAGESEWVAFGDNSDAVDRPHRLADADFYNLTELLRPDERRPVGFESLVRIGRLPLITGGVETLQVSSFDRTEGNQDGGSGAAGLETYFYREGDAEVILEVDGPGQISRIWFADSNDPSFPSTRIQFFFDHATQVSYEITVSAMMAGNQPPFVRPLVLNSEHSSGGWISYVPIPFSQGVKMRLVGPHAHYQVTYQVFADAVGVETFTGLEDYSLAQHLWARPGEDPKPTRGNRTVHTGGAIQPGNTVTLANLTSSGVVQSLKLWLPQLNTSILGTPPLEDTLRAHLHGQSAFSLVPTVPSVPTRLRLRRDCWPAPQRAEVKVDGQDAGSWLRSQGDSRYRWCDDTFDLPMLPEDSRSLPFVISSSSADNPWQEARYWLEQQISGDWQVVDLLDVGDPVSEEAHGYRIEAQVASESRTHTYSPLVRNRPDSERLLRDLRLQVTVDGLAEPVINAPVGAFFGSGVGESNIESLLAGIDPEQHLFYSYLPMPFGSAIRISLANHSTIPVEGFFAEVAHAPIAYPNPGGQTGYLRVFESLSRPTVLGLDHPLLDAQGSGQLVGLHLLVHSGNEGLIEGDERFHVDGTRTPQPRGTGTEDVFNGAWYYNRGRFTTALHGASSTRSEGWIDQYRWYLGDHIPFADRLAGGIEHGGVNDINADYSSWAYVYLSADSAMLREDVVDFADGDSVVAHDVQLAGTAHPFVMTGQFEGDDDNELTGGGYRLESGAALTATLAIDPRARYVILRRRYDQGEHKERLRVWVDGVLAGTWLDGGRNSSRRWRESRFFLPPALTEDKSSLSIRLEPMPWAGTDGATIARLSALSLCPDTSDLWLPLITLS